MMLIIVTACSGQEEFGSDEHFIGETEGDTRQDGATRLTNPPRGASDQNPAFSPDGSQLIFARFENGYNEGPAAIYLFDLASGAVDLLTFAPDSDNVNLPGTSWSTATNRIAFSSDREDTDEIWTMASDGRDLFRVTSHLTEAHFIEPSFSPDGQWIVFEVEGDEQGSIWKVQTDGTGLTRLTHDTAFDDRQPNWSPVGDRILFQRRVLGSDDWNLYAMSSDGSDIRQVTLTLSEDTDASWSPDGRWVVYASDYGGLPASNIFIISVDGGDPIRVTRDPARYDGAPSWSPDGEWIAFESHPGDDDAPASVWRIAAPALEKS